MWYILIAVYLLGAIISYKLSIFWFTKKWDVIYSDIPYLIMMAITSWLSIIVIVLILLSEIPKSNKILYHKREK